MLHYVRNPEAEAQRQLAETHIAELDAENKVQTGHSNVQLPSMMSTSCVLQSCCWLRHAQNRMAVLTQALRTQLQQLEAQQQQRSDAAAQPAIPDAQPGMAKALAEAEVTIVKRKVHNSSG